MRGPLFSSQGMDSEVLVRVVVGIQAKVFPRIWEDRSDGREPKVWRGRADGESFILGNSSFSCLIVDGGVWSGGPMRR